MRRRYLILASTLLSLAACDAGKSSSQSSDAPKFGTFGIDLAQMDTTARPGEDFYRYVNGNWLTTFTIPPDKARYGVFTLLADKAEVDVRTLIEEIAKKSPAPNTVGQKVSDLYSSWMDTTTIESLGIKPIEEDLKRISAASSKADLEKLKIGRAHV